MNPTEMNLSLIMLLNNQFVHLNYYPYPKNNHQFVNLHQHLFFNDVSCNIQHLRKHMINKNYHPHCHIILVVFFLFLYLDGFLFILLIYLFYSYGYFLLSFFSVVIKHKLSWWVFKTWRIFNILSLCLSSLFYCYYWWYTIRYFI